MTSTQYKWYFLPIVLLSILFIQFFTLTNTAFAQSERVDCGTPVCIDIESATFNDSTREAEVLLNMWNNNEVFVDGMKYSVEFHTGDELPEYGYIFGDLQYVTQVQGDMPPLHPNESIQITASIEIPINVDGGNYFLRTKAWNEDRSIYGISFSREPLVISGDGGFLPYLDAALIHPDTGIAHLLMEGPFLTATSVPKIAILQKRNPQLFEQLEDEELFVSYEVRSLAKPDEVVSSSERYPLGLLVRPDRRAVEIDVEPWDDIQPGPYTLYLSFTDFKGNKIVDNLEARLLYEGFYSRMYDIRSGINSYRKGEPLNIDINTVSAGETDIRNLTLKATLIDTNGGEQVYSADVPISGNFLGDDQWVSFGNQKIKKTAVIEGLSFVLMDESTGVIYDEQFIEMDTDVTYAYPEQKGGAKVILGLLAVLVVVIILAVFLKKKGNNVAVAVILSVSVIGGVLLYSSADSVFADAVLGPADIEVSFNNGPCGPPDQDDDGIPDSEDPDMDGDGTPDDEQDPPPEEASNDENGDDCPKPRLNGYLLRIWSTPSNEPSGPISDADCEDCVDVTYYVKMQCKDCGNSGLGLDVTFTNNYPGPSTTDYSLTTILNTQFMIDYGYYSVKRDAYEERALALGLPITTDDAVADGEVQSAPAGSLAGVPVNANDIINWWIWGPFVDEACIEVDEIDSYIESVEQTYNINATTQFGPSTCALSFEYDYSYNSVGASLDDPRTITPSCAELQVTKYIDDNENGVWDTGEIYFKDVSAPLSCSGTETEMTGAVISQGVSGNYKFGSGTYNNGPSYTDLASAQCNDSNRPYFFEDEILPGTYLPGLTIDDFSAEWEITGIELEHATTGARTPIYSSVIPMTTNTLQLEGGDKEIALMGLRNTGYPVAFSCSTDPEQIYEVPTTADFNIEAYQSLIYDISELNFVWEGETGTAGNQTISGGNNNGRFTTTYDGSTGGVQDYDVEVTAYNTSGTQVSATRTCTLEELVCGSGFVIVDGQCTPELTASCAAYDNAAGSGNPQLFFGPGEDVYWKATQSGGDDPYTWDWTNDASGDTQIVGPYSVGPGGDYVYSDVDPTYTANVEVRDRQAEVEDVACSISVKECNVNADCQSGEICRFDDFTCGPPIPVVIEPLFLAPAVVNEGAQCNMSWEIDNAFTCDLYRNGNLIVADAATSTANFPVDPGSYLLSCDNGAGDTIDAGPARCLLNPEVRES